MELRERLQTFINSALRKYVEDKGLTVRV
jgi:hypothetical protein